MKETGIWGKHCGTGKQGRGNGTSQNSEDGGGEGESTEYVDFMNRERYNVGTGGDRAVERK